MHYFKRFLTCKVITYKVFFFFQTVTLLHVSLFPFISTLARLLFPAVDDNLLKFLYDDNQRVEPEWYIPIIPMVLINGAEGIGTGWACKLPNYDAREIVNNVRRMLDGLDPHPMVMMQNLLLILVFFCI